jgi:hypothetical protein
MSMSSRLDLMRDPCHKIRVETHTQAAEAKEDRYCLGSHPPAGSSDSGCLAGTDSVRIFEPDRRPGRFFWHIGESSQTR